MTTRQVQNHLYLKSVDEVRDWLRLGDLQGQVLKLVQHGYDE
jgi:hypothetical protein